jgi:hypothetical protein
MRFARVSSRELAATERGLRRAGTGGNAMTSKTSALTGMIAALGFICFSISPANAKEEVEKQTIGGLAAAGPDACPDGSFAQLDPDGSGEWECLSPAELKALFFTKIVFVTSDPYTGDLVSAANDLAGSEVFGTEQGLEAGDYICNDHAANADPDPLPGKYVAWLSKPGSNAKDRLTPGSGPFVKLDGEVVADDIYDLTHPPLQSPIDINEDGDGKNAPVMTGTSPAGLYSGNSCDGWNTTDSTVDWGFSYEIDSTWTLHDNFYCHLNYRLYCFQR